MDRSVPIPFGDYMTISIDDGKTLVLAKQCIRDDVEDFPDAESSLTYSYRNHNLTIFMLVRIQTGGLPLRQWISGAVGGFIGGIAFALVIQYGMSEDVLLRAIPSLYGVSGPALVIGWIFHLFHSVLFGLLYAKIASYDQLTQHTTDPIEGMISGVIYGFHLVIIIAVLYALAMLTGIPVPEKLPLPYVSMISYFGHLVFGGVLGIVYALLAGE